MDDQPTTLSDVIRLIQEVLPEHYGVDPAPLFNAVGIDPARAEVSGSRVSREAVMRLWEVAAAQTNDPSIGLVVGSKVRATTFYALGMAFVTCETLRHSLELLCRYYQVIATVPMHLELIDRGKTTALEITYTDRQYPLLPIPFDSFIASIIGFCRLASKPEFKPVEVRLACGDNDRGGDYRALFQSTVVFDAKKNALVFDRASLDEPLPGRSIDLFHATDRILAQYIAALNPDKVSTEVRKMLLGLLPTGRASQDEIARHLNMSRSTLQRRLQQEKTNYKELLESTRCSLALEYVKEGQHSLSYVAFLLGFSDQSNFSRAFRRWTGVSPKAFRDQLSGGEQAVL
jgi:AraC-like DNA-binding protein